MPKLLLKVCGLTRAEDMALCHALHADFVGMIFAKKSPRYITPEQASQMPAGHAKRVGVFVKEDLKTLQDTAKLARLDYIQLHGNEDVDYCRAVGRERVIKVLWPDKLSKEELLNEIERFAPVSSYFLFDAGQSGGGSGEELKRSNLIGLTPPLPWLLAGGIGHTNIEGILKEISPDGLDMNSALEDKPGIKNSELVRQAFLIAHSLSTQKSDSNLEKQV